ncbi:MAG TPA: hypothetical protein VNS55_14325 [Nocardioides sp.]|nr:hypothetical protein [Nocardioides sp.]
MSKESALRAMREARYSRRSATPAPGVAPRGPGKAEEPVAVAPPASTDGLCGHRSMNGRTCTREHGHAAKNHRYS